ASSSSYVNAESQGRKTLTYGEIKEVDGEYIYFYINASIIPVESTTRILTIQLMAVTVLCFVLAVFISLIMSKQLSDPIVSLTKSAERLAQGDFSVKFEGKGYNEIDKLSDTLNYATEELQKTENFRKDILANVSHELRTPLTMIKAYAEMIQDISGENPDKRNKHLQVIIEESERLKILVNDILDLSKLQAGVEQYVKAPFNLSLAVERIAAAFSGSFAKSGYSFKTDVAEGIEINCDGKRIEQVIYNLIANAVNYSGDDKRITVKLIKEEWGAIFSVSDRGYGIPADSIPTIFDRFFTGKHSKRPVTGSGIGLSLVKSILTAHNYDYGVESRENEGSTFYVVFKPYTVTE
ncbi:MAG TPA: HAMP domain-containing sensor histidine kinase, partial [Eubacteriales bacterium]|nr:HAMP domain-containing sensor histidine kinase [Eubacteriales bacterium]